MVVAETYGEIQMRGANFVTTRIGGAPLALRTAGRGQMIKMEGESMVLGLAEVERLHAPKTGRLIRHGAEADGLRALARYVAERRN